MTNLTATLALPCQTGADDPCLFDETWCELARLVDAEFTRLDGIRDRLVPAIPAIAWDFVGPVTVLAGGLLNLPVTSVDFDTDDMFNPDLSAFRVFPRRTGYYAATGHLTLLDGGSTDSDMSIYITSGRFGPSVFTGGGGVTGSVVNDNYGAFPPGSGSPDYMDTSTVIRVTSSQLIGSGGLGYGLGYQCGLGATATVSAGRFQMYWLRDL